MSDRQNVINKAWNSDPRLEGLFQPILDFLNPILDNEQKVGLLITFTTSDPINSMADYLIPILDAEQKRQFAGICRGIAEHLGQGLH